MGIPGRLWYYRPFPFLRRLHGRSGRVGFSKGEYYDSPRPPSRGEVLHDAALSSFRPTTDKGEHGGVWGNNTHLPAEG